MEKMDDEQLQIIQKKVQTYVELERNKDLQYLKDQLFTHWYFELSQIKLYVKTAYRRATDKQIKKKERELILPGSTSKPLSEHDFGQIHYFFKGDEIHIELEVRDYIDFNDFWTKSFLKNFKESIENLAKMEDHVDTKIIEKVLTDIQRFKFIQDKIETRLVRCVRPVEDEIETI